MLPIRAGPDGASFADKTGPHVAELPTAGRSPRIFFHDSTFTKHVAREPQLLLMRQSMFLDGVVKLMNVSL